MLHLFVVQPVTLPVCVLRDLFVQSGAPFRKLVLLGWVVKATVQSAIIFFICYAGFGYNIILEDGNATAMWDFSILCTTACVIIVNLKVALITQYWTVSDLPLLT